MSIPGHPPSVLCPYHSHQCSCWSALRDLRQHVMLMKDCKCVCTSLLEEMPANKHPTLRLGHCFPSCALNTPLPLRRVQVFFDKPLEWRDTERAGAAHGAGRRIVRACHSLCRQHAPPIRYVPTASHRSVTDNRLSGTLPSQLGLLTKLNALCAPTSAVLPALALKARAPGSR